MSLAEFALENCFGLSQIEIEIFVRKTAIIHNCQSISLTLIIVSALNGDHELKLCGDIKIYVHKISAFRDR